MGSLMRRFLFAAVVVLAATRTRAQVIEAFPANPTSANPITVRVVLWHSGYFFDSFQVNGSVITIRYENRAPSVAPIVGTDDVTIGLLPAGTYTINVRYLSFGENDEIIEDRTEGPFTLVVAAANFIPALDARGMLVLVLGIAATAIVLLKR
jgi:hypothetical protein